MTGMPNPMVFMQPVNNMTPEGPVHPTTSAPTSSPDVISALQAQINSLQQQLFAVMQANHMPTGLPQAQTPTPTFSQAFTSPSPATTTLHPVQSPQAVHEQNSSSANPSTSSAAVRSSSTQETTIETAMSDMVCNAPLAEDEEDANETPEQVLRRRRSAFLDRQSSTGFQSAE